MNPLHQTARRLLRRAPALAAALLLCASASADTLLPEAAQVLAAINQHPAVVQATLGQDAARHAAGMLAVGPHEWTVGGQLQQRRASGAGSNAEWQLALSRPLRWGDKARLDRQLGAHGEEIARWQLAAARREAAAALLDAWLDWRGAEAGRGLAEAQLALGEEQLKVVVLRQRAGDAARLDRLAAEADLADQRRLAATARAAEARAAAVLQARFPGLPLVPGTLPAPPALAAAAADEAALADWLAAAVDASPVVRQAEAALALAEAQSARTRAERRPDPTVGVYTALEAARTERVVGLSFSVPIGGDHRDLATREQAAREAAARAALAAVRRERGAQMRPLWLDRQDSLTRWRLAEAAATAQQEAAALVRKAYAAGEAEMPALLQARRLALEAAQTALATRVEALRAEHRLALEAGRLWADATR